MFSSHGHIPMWTSTTPPTAVLWGYASVCDGWISLVGVTAPPGDFKPLWSFLGQQKKTFLSLVSHNLSLLSW